MVETFSERVDITDTQNRVTITLNGKEGKVKVNRWIKGSLPGPVGGLRDIINLDTNPDTLYLYSDLKIGFSPKPGTWIPIPFPYSLKFDASNAVLNIGSGDMIQLDGAAGNILIRDNDGNERIQLDGGTGDIKLSGADCAEEFEVVESENIDPGTTLVINNDGKLCPCNRPYDKKVVGVVSGGRGIHPGIILGKKPKSNLRLPVALSGKVYCKVDAHYNPIKVGDLLTTSSTVGHAMKATDSSRAFGTVIGKALENLDNGVSSIPILVALQ